LRSSDPATRAEAARKAGVSSNRTAVAQLIPLLDDEESQVRVAAADALGNLGDLQAIAPLKRLLAAKATGKRKPPAGSPDERQAVLRALSKFRESGVEPLAEFLHSEDRELRRAAAETLGSMGFAQAVPHLSGCLEDSRSEVRKAAAQALGLLGESSALRALAGTASNRDPETRRVAVEAIGRIGGTGALEPLGQAVRDQDESVQLAAITALQEIGGVAAARALKPALETGRKSVRVAAASALNRMELAPGDPADRAFVAVLKGDFPAAIREGEAALPSLVEAIGSTEPGIRSSAAEALGRLRASAAVPLLVRHLKDSDETVRRSSAAALTEIGSEAIPGLVEALSDPSERTLRLAAEALGRIGDPQAVGPLLATLERCREDLSNYPGSLEAARSVRDALVAILSVSAEKVDLAHLQSISETPDLAVPWRPTAADASPQLGEGIECGVLRDAAQQESARRRQ